MTLVPAGCASSILVSHPMEDFIARIIEAALMTALVWLFLSVLMTEEEDVRLQGSESPEQRESTRSKCPSCSDGNATRRPSV